MLWHFGKLEQFLKVNVQGTENLLAFCSAGMPKTLNHISTLAVSGGAATTQRTCSRKRTST